MSEKVTNKKKTRLKKILEKSLAIAFGLVLSVVLAEVILHIIGFSNPLFYIHDDLLGGSYLPGASGVYTKEGRAYVKINSHGYRDAERSVAKPGGTYRIAVLGDSFTSAMQVDREESFSALVEDRLNQIVPKGYDKVEVLNFGRDGFGTAHQLLLLQHRVWKYSPDAVILAFYAGNDVSDNHKDLDMESEHQLFELKDGKLVHDAAHTDHYSPSPLREKSARFLKTVINHSKVLQLLFKVVRPPSQPSGGNADQFNKWLGYLHHVKSQKTVYNEPDEKVWKEAWTITEALIREMRFECERNNADFAIVSISAPAQVHPDPEFRNNFTEDLGIEDLFYPDKRMLELSARENIPILCLAPELLKIAGEKNIYFHGFERGNFPIGSGHWNQSGHKYAAELMVPWLLEQLTAYALASGDSAKNGLPTK